MASEIEKQIWAAAFAAEFVKENDFVNRHGGGPVVGFSVAEIADSAVEKYREAVSGWDKDCLLPVKEGWEPPPPKKFNGWEISDRSCDWFSLTKGDLAMTIMKYSGRVSVCPRGGGLHIRNYKIAVTSDDEMALEATRKWDEPYARVRWRHKWSDGSTSEWTTEDCGSDPPETYITEMKPEWQDMYRDDDHYRGIETEILMVSERDNHEP